MFMIRGRKLGQVLIIMTGADCRMAQYPNESIKNQKRTDEVSRVSFTPGLHNTEN
jgi:hypothetical protein